MECICPIDAQFTHQISALLKPPTAHQVQEYYEQLIIARQCCGLNGDQSVIIGKDLRWGFLQLLDPSKFSCGGYLFSAVLAIFLPKEYKNQVTMGKFIAEQIIFYIGTFVVFLCWELSHHLHQVLHTKWFTFAPSKGSATAETNPSEPLLAILEERSKSFLQYLAHLDLCMVCEGNADTWRQAAFFEESGETYKRVLAVCLRPLEQLTLKLGEGVESYSDNAFKVSHQLSLPTEKSSRIKPLASFL